MDSLKGLIDAVRADAGANGTAELAPIANRPLICHVLRAMAQLGVAEVGVLADEQGAAAIRRILDGQQLPVMVRYVDRPVDGDELETVAAMADFAAGSPLLIHPGDTLVRAPLDRAVRDFAAGDIAATLIAGTRRPGAADPTTLEARRMTRLLAALRPDAPELADTGVRLVAPAFFDAVPARVPGCRQGEASGAITALRADGARVVVEAADDWWQFDGTLDTLLDGNRRVLDEMNPTKPPATDERTRIQGRVRIHPTAKIESSTIRGPVIVGPGARVSDAYVGPYTAIGAGVELRGAEIENSILLSRARVEFVGRRIEASIVGADARISRDFSLPKAVRLWVGDRAEVCLT